MKMEWPSGLNWTVNLRNDKLFVMRKINLSLGMIALAVMLTGCGATIPELTTEQEELICEYAAGLMLKYDKKYSGRLLNDETLAIEEAKESDARAKEKAYRDAREKAGQNKKEEPEENTDSASDSGSVNTGIMDDTVSDIASFYGIEGVNISYTGYSICDSYPENGEDMFFAMDATEGHKLLILKFDVSNLSADTVRFDMFYRNPGFGLSVNGGDRISQQYTLLLDDMAAYNGDIDAGVTEQMILAYEIKEDVSNIDSLVLSLKGDDKKGSMVLQ